MSIHLYSAIFLLSVFSFFATSFAILSLRRQRAVALTGNQLKVIDGKWHLSLSQSAHQLMHEERHVLAKKGTTYSIVREERYRSAQSGEIVASLPPKKIADCESKQHAQELMSFFEEVTLGTTTAIDSQLGPRLQEKAAA